MSDQHSCSNEATKPPAMPLLSDGIGMSFDQVIADLAAQHKTIVSKDDPILMVVTILNAFLTEEGKLMDRHRKALTSILADRTDHYVQAVEQTISCLGESLSSSSLSEIKKIFVEHDGTMNRFRSSITWLAAIIGTSALVNVAVFVWR